MLQSDTVEYHGLVELCLTAIVSPLTTVCYSKTFVQVANLAGASSAFQLAVHSHGRGTSGAFVITSILMNTTALWLNAWTWLFFSRTETPFSPHFLANKVLVF